MVANFSFWMRFICIAWSSRFSFSSLWVFRIPPTVDAKREREDRQGTVVRAKGRSSSPAGGGVPAGEDVCRGDENRDRNGDKNEERRHGEDPERCHWPCGDDESGDAAGLLDLRGGDTRRPENRLSRA
jgi:hypothetical protein